MVISGKNLKEAFYAGTALLLSNVDYINELNVFPVPDGDTGTNMSMTLKSAIKQLEDLKTNEIKDVCAAISSGSLRGARGNSGVIMSQILRGFTNHIKELNEINEKDLLKAAEIARDTAYKAVIKPKEGTILTVIGGIAEKAKQYENSDLEPLEIFENLVKHGDEVLEQTPELLPILKEAGVVDSGGKGLMTFLHGALSFAKGEKVDLSILKKDNISSGATTNINMEVEENIDIKFGYCTEFIVNKEENFTDKEVENLREYLLSIGDSLVVVPMDNFIKVHVHTNHPGEAFEKGLSMGFLTNMKIDNMRFEHEEKLIKDASKKAKLESPKTSEKPKNIGKIVVSNGDGLDTIFKDLGADYIINGGQSMNPSCEDFVEVISKVNAKNILIFPNNSNIIMAAKQAKDIVKDKNIYVVETKHIVEGINCLIYLEEKENIEEMIFDFKSTIQNVKAIETTYAVRDTNVDGVDVKQNDFISIGNKGLLSSDKDIIKSVLEAFEKVKADTDSIISIYYGNEIKEEDAEILKNKILEKYSNLDISCYYGGQSVYYYYISIE